MGITQRIILFHSLAFLLFMFMSPKITPTKIEMSSY